LAGASSGASGRLVRRILLTRQGFGWVRLLNGVRRSLVRIQSPRHCKASHSNRLRLAFFPTWGLVPTPWAELWAEISPFRTIRSLALQLASWLLPCSPRYRQAGSTPSWFEDQAHTSCHKQLSRNGFPSKRDREPAGQPPVD